MKPRQPGADRAHPNGSTGPRSAAGKARSSMNALKSGIYSKALTIPGEDPKQLTTLAEEYFERFRPALPEQRDLVDILVRSTWTLRRLAVAEAQIFSHEMDNAYKLDKDSPIGHAFSLSDRTLSRLQRMVNSTQHNFRDALRELERLDVPPLDTQSPVSTAGPTPVPDPPSTPQTVENESVNHSSEFVPSSSAPPPSDAPKVASQPRQKSLPFHRVGSNCHFDPIDRGKYKRCPSCFPENCYPDGQE